MNFNEFQKCANSIQFIEYNKFILYNNADGVVIVGVDETSDKWKHFGFDHKNRISWGMDTIEEAVAWAKGFLAYHEHLKMANR
jgi:hypothetical protein